MAEGAAETRPSRWRGRAGWILLALGAAERIIGWGGSLDFLISRSQDPGWVGDVLTFVAAQAPYLGFVSIMAGVALIVWNERRRTAQLLEARIPSGPTGDAVDPNPAVRRLNAVVRIEDLEKFRDWFRKHAGEVDSTTGAISMFFHTYAERVERYQSEAEHPLIDEDRSKTPLGKIQGFRQSWDEDVALVVAKAVEVFGDRANLVFDQPRLDLALDNEPEGLDLNALLSFRAFQSRSANFRVWREKVRGAIRAEIEHLNAVRRGEA
jgi:hypothetical protein